MKAKHDKSNGSGSDRENSFNGGGKMASKNGHSYSGGGHENDDSMSGGDRSRSSSPIRGERERDRSSKGVTKEEKVDHDLLSIYIGNVDYAATEEELRNCFIGCGDIIRVTIIKNMKTGHPKGAAFIEFTDKDGVAAAMSLNGKEVKGRPLIVTTKKPRPDTRHHDARPAYTHFDRHAPVGRPPAYASSSSSYGGGRSQYESARPSSYGSSSSMPSRGGASYYGHRHEMDDGRRPSSMQMEQPMPPRMPPSRYDPYRRPEGYGYEPMYVMAPRGGGGGPPPPQYYSDPRDHHDPRMERMDPRMGERSSGHGRGGPPPPQRYSQPSYPRR